MPNMGFKLLVFSKHFEFIMKYNKLLVYLRYKKDKLLLFQHSSEAELL